MNPDELKNQKADRWDALVAQGVSPSEATRRVNQEFASKAAPAQTPVTREEQAPPPPPGAAPLTPSARRAGRIRSAVQGATFNVGEEAEAFARSLLPGGRSYGEEVKQIRQSLEEYRKQAPGEAFALEMAGGLAVPGVGGVKAAQMASRAGKAAKATSRLGEMAQTAARVGRAAVATPTRQAFVQGALSGAGAAEGGIGERLFGATAGGTVGGTAGATMGKLATAAGNVAQRGLRFEKGGTSAVRRALEQAEMPSQELVARAGQMGPEETVADLIGEPAIRALRSIRSIGGRGSRQIGETMAERTDTSPERLVSAVYGQRRAPENIVEAIDQSIIRGQELSDPLYKAFEKEAPKSIPKIDKIIDRPLMQQAVDRARRNAANEGRQFIEPAVPEQAGAILDELGRPIMQKAKAARYNPQSLDDIKKAMDALIYEGRYGNVQPGQGGILPGEVGTMKDLLKQFVGAVDEAYPSTYPEARAAWGGEFSFRSAMKEGERLANELVSPEQISKELAEYDEVGVEALRRGYLDGLRRRIEDGKVKAQQVSSEGFAKRVRAILGDDEGQRVVDAFRKERDLVNAARTILGKPQGVDVTEDLFELGGSEATTFVSRGGPRRAGLAGVREVLQRATEPMLGARRQAAAETLLTRRTGIQDILDALSKEEAIRRRSGIAGQLYGGAVARGLGTSVGNF